MTKKESAKTMLSEQQREKMRICSYPIVSVVTARNPISDFALEETV